MLHPNHRRAFSLIELVIVVVIIGVLAAIAIPRMSSGADGAKTNAVKANLAVLRQAIELHKAERGRYPGVGADADGTATFSADTFVTDLTTESADGTGPYLRAIPEVGVGTNPDSNSVGSTTDNPPTEAAGTTGWLFNSSAGDIWANATDFIDL